MNTSIVIVTWNTRDLLARCLESIFADSPIDGVEVFVVDNASSDGSAAMVRKRFPQIYLIENEINIGFARANNQALRQCQGRYWMLLNPDVEVKAGAIQALVSFFDGHSKVGAVGPRVLNPDGSLQLSCSPAPTLFRETLRLMHGPGVRSDGYYPMHMWEQKLPRQVDILLGACLFLRRQAIDQIGLLDEDYFIYSEEVDLCTRLNKAGWELYWVPQAEIIHYGGQSTQQVAQEMFFRLYESKLTYFRKHQGSLAARLYKLLLGTTALTRIASAPLALLSGPDDRQRRLTLVENYKRLLLSLPGM
jgi:GT2 family glycosyltransferase